MLNLQYFYYFKDNEDNNCYYKNHTLSNKQVCRILFGEYTWYTENKIEFYVAFAVADKKKDLNNWFNGDKPSRIDHKISGTCGLEALLFAKNSIRDFEEWLKIYYEIYLKKDYVVRICVDADDNRRMRVYKRGLRDLGYKTVNRMGKWILCKRIVWDENEEIKEIWDEK